MGDDGEPAPDERLVSTAVAFAFQALVPDNKYTQELAAATTDLYNPLLGFYEGFYEKTGKTAIGFTSSTNSTILQSLLYSATQQPLIHPNRNAKSPWWRAIALGNSGRGLPTIAKPQAQMISDDSGKFWVTSDR